VRNVRIGLLGLAGLLLPASAYCQEEGILGSWANAIVALGAFLYVLIVVGFIGFVAWVVGLILTIADAAQHRPRAQGFLWAFLGSFVASIVLGILAPIGLLVSIADITLLVVYLSQRGKAAVPSSSAQRVCAQCGAKLETSWPRCPFCTPRPAAQPSAPPQVPSGMATTPIASARRAEPIPIRVSSSGQKTVVIGKQEFPVFALLIMKEGSAAGREFPLYEKRTVIGRDGIQAQIVVDDESVGRQHAAVVYRDDTFTVTDLASTNGTFVNPKGHDDEPITAPKALNDGDVIAVGRTKFVYKRAW